VLPVAICISYTCDNFIRNSRKTVLKEAIEQSEYKEEYCFLDAFSVLYFRTKELDGSRYMIVVKVATVARHK